jgi:hypothetical protein
VALVRANLRDEREMLGNAVRCAANASPSAVRARSPSRAANVRSTSATKRSATRVALSAMRTEKSCSLPSKWL